MRQSDQAQLLEPSQERYFIEKLAKVVLRSRGDSVVSNFQPLNVRRLLICLSSKDSKPAPFAAVVQLYGPDDKLLRNAMVADKDEYLCPVYLKNHDY